jgi:hypothetical protein
VGDAHLPPCGAKKKRKKKKRNFDHERVAEKNRKREERKELNL